MIRAKLLLMEYDIMNNPVENNEKLKAVKSLKKLLKEIDFDVEIVPLNSERRLSSLLVLIKMKPLNDQELAIVNALIDR